MKPLYYVPVVLVVRANNRDDATAVVADIGDRMTGMVTALDGYLFLDKYVPSPAGPDWDEADHVLVTDDDGDNLIEAFAPFS